MASIISFLAGLIIIIFFLWAQPKDTHTNSPPTSHEQPPASTRQSAVSIPGVPGATIGESSYECRRIIGDAAASQGVKFLRHGLSGRTFVFLSHASTNSQIRVVCDDDTVGTYVSITTNVATADDFINLASSLARIVSGISPEHAAWHMVKCIRYSLMSVSIYTVKSGGLGAECIPIKSIGDGLAERIDIYRHKEAR